jgi:7-cyano-7-deazaguanine reductase
MNEIEKIASVHLGKAGDGSVVKPYVTPDNVDKNLLVSIPRHLNRTAYGIKDDSLPFYGYDTWNAYEFSTMTRSGFPVSGVVTIIYQYNSPNIVESKSVKLYLNSFNMAQLIDNPGEIYIALDMIEDHIGQAIGSHDVTVDFTPASQEITMVPIIGDFISLENYVDVSKVKFTDYNESPDILQLEKSYKRYASKWRSHSLRSNCRVTNQPDWGDVYIHILAENVPTPESLLQYVVSMRKENHFHEEIAECIYKRLHDLCKPEELLVACLYTRRGGIDINPVRASSEQLYVQYTNLFRGTCKKTTRQ